MQKIKCDDYDEEYIYLDDGNHGEPQIRRLARWAKAPEDALEIICEER